MGRGRSGARPSRLEAVGAERTERYRRAAVRRIRTVEDWYAGFATSMSAVEHLLFGTLVIDPATGRAVARNRRAAELLGNVPDSVADWVAAGVMTRPAFDELAALAAADGPQSWRRDVTLHLAAGRAELTVIGAVVTHAPTGARAVVAMVFERGQEHIWVAMTLPDPAPLQLQFTYDDDLRIRGIDPRMGLYWDDPRRELGAYIWVCIHPADLHLVVPWVDRLVAGELESVEYTVRVITHVGNWTPARFELRRLLSAPDAEAAIAVTLTLVGEFKDTIADGVLTPRETAVVAALFDGRRVPQIAARDGVSVKTLRNQLTAVYRKLGVADQGQLLETYHRPVTGGPVLTRVQAEAWARRPPY